MKYLWQVLFVCADHRTVTIQAPNQPLSSIYLFLFDILVFVLSPSCASSHIFMQKEVPSLLSTGIFPMLTADWNSWPFPLFFSILTQTLRNTNLLCSQYNQAISQGIYSKKIILKRITCHSAKACLLSKTSSLNHWFPFLMHSGNKRFISSKCQYIEREQRHSDTTAS